MAEFLQMGGYGAYVWSAWGITALVLVANIFGARARERASRRDLAGRLRRAARRQRP